MTGTPSKHDRDTIKTGPGHHHNMTGTQSKHDRDTTKPPHSRHHSRPAPSRPNPTTPVLPHAPLPPLSPQSRPSPTPVASGPTPLPPHSCPHSATTSSRAMPWRVNAIKPAANYIAVMDIGDGTLEFSFIGDGTFVFYFQEGGAGRTENT